MSNIGPAKSICNSSLGSLNLGSALNPDLGIIGIKLCLTLVQALLAVFCLKGDGSMYLGKPDKVRQSDHSHLARVGSVYCNNDQVLQLVWYN